MNRKVRQVLFVLALLSFGLSVRSLSQSEASNRERIIRAEKPAPIAEDGDRPALQVVELSIGNRAVDLNSAFLSDDNWLTDLKIRVKNVSGRRLYCIGVAFGLLAEIETKLQTQESWPWGMGFYRGRCGLTKDNQPNFMLNPGQETVLLYDDIPQIHRKLITRMGGLRKAVVHRDAHVAFKKKQTLELPLTFSSGTKFINEEPY